MSAKNSLDGFQAVPTGGALGAEIRGVDFTQPLPGETAQAMRDAWTEHLVLLFRGQDPQAHLIPLVHEVLVPLLLCTTQSTEADQNKESLRGKEQSYQHIASFLSSSLAQSS